MKTSRIAKQLPLHVAGVLAIVIASASFNAGAAPVGAEGSSCTVTSGGNAGKSGTVTVETDDQGGTHTWCEGSWGATECTGSNKCSAALHSLNGVRPVFGAGTATLLQSSSSSQPAVSLTSVLHPLVLKR